MNVSTGTLEGLASLAILPLLALGETLAPANLRPAGILRRWARNITVGGIGILLTHVIPGATLVAISVWGRSQGFGLLAGLPSPWATVLMVPALDLAVWAQHRASHAWPWLWRLHRVHHGDPALDLSTAFRFHPLELGVSLVWKAFMVLLLGGPTAGVLVFEGLLQAGNLFEHANIRLPASVDRILPWVLATPRIHAIHHSTDHRDQRSNYGFFLSLWDRLFHSFRFQSIGKGPLVLGLGDGLDRSLLGMLRHPFEPTPSSDPER
jgi:sterol desaturase/sphingolipid hydroxylase (fatty acid hydroxylase superfamily)